MPAGYDFLVSLLSPVASYNVCTGETPRFWPTSIIEDGSPS